MEQLPGDPLERGAGAAAGRTNAIRIEAARAQGLAEAQTQVDVATFIAWADADQRGEQELAEFYVDRFRAEFRTAFDAWLATEPAHQRRRATDAVRHARVPGRVAGRGRSGWTREAEASAAEVRQNIQRASNYVLTVVLYAVVLFFAGMSTRIANPRLRWVLTIAGCLVFIGAIAWIATFPVSLAI